MKSIKTRLSLHVYACRKKEGKFKVKLHNYFIGDTWRKRKLRGTSAEGKGKVYDDNAAVVRRNFVIALR